MNKKLIIIPIMLLIFWQITAYYNNNKPKLTLRLQVKSEVPKDAIPIPISISSINCPTPVPTEKTKEELVSEKNMDELNSSTAIQKDVCINKGMGYQCNSMTCQCIVNNEQSCNDFKNSLSEEDKKRTQIYWDPHVWINNGKDDPNHKGSCISTIYDLNVGLMKTLEDADAKKGSSYAYEAGEVDTAFSWVQPYLKCDNLTDGEGACSIISPFDINVPSGYCGEEYVDHTEDERCDAAGVTYNTSCSNVNISGPKRQRNIGYCYVNKTQEVFENMFGSALVRAVRGGDIDYLIKKINPINAVADVFCAKVLGKEAGCGFPRIFPSVGDIIWFAKGIISGITNIIDAFGGGFDKGIIAIGLFAYELGKRIGDILEGALKAVLDLIVDLGKAIVSLFEDIGEAFEDFFSDIGDALGCCIS